MRIFAGKDRVASGAIFLYLACCHVTTLAAISLDASSGKALYSTGNGASGGSGSKGAEDEDLCGVVPRTGCVPLHPSGMSRLSEIPADLVVGGGSSADDSEEEGESGVGSVNRPRTGNRMLWNVPFRMPYGVEDKRKFMFGKRDFSEDKDDNIRKRSGGRDRNSRKFKFGKRMTEEEDTGSEELDDNPETGYDGRLDATAMTSSGSETPDLDRNDGSSSGSEGRSKRKFKFGKKSEEKSIQEREEEEEEEEENEEEMEEEKRKVLFGKRYGTLGDAGESVEWKRRAKFQFGKRQNSQSYPYEIFPKLKTKFKLGK